MTHGSPEPSPHTSASLAQIYRLPGTVFGHCICTHIGPIGSKDEADSGAWGSVHGKGYFGGEFGRSIVTNGDFTTYVCDSSQITLGRLVTYSLKAKGVNQPLQYLTCPRTVGRFACRLSLIIYDLIDTNQYQR